MGQTPRQGELFLEVNVPEGTTFINERCMVRTRDGHRMVIVAGIVIAQYALSDRMAEAHAMVSLIEQGWADQKGRQRAFSFADRERWDPAPKKRKRFRFFSGRKARVYMCAGL
jgi:hypothetical protein